MATLFTQIIEGEIPSAQVYQDEHCVAFRDINPVAPTHILVVPRREIARLDEACEEDSALLGHLLLVAARVAKQEEIEGFRVIINNGAAAGQTVFHLHIHVIGGRALKWPPG